MRASVVVVSSVNASLNNTNRNVRLGERDPDLYDFATVPPRGTRPTKRPLRAVIPQTYEEFSRRRHRKAVNKGNTAGQIPFPRSHSPPNEITRESSRSTNSEDQSSLRSSTNSTNGVADAASQEGIFARCFTFLKHVGVNMIMPPYTTDEGLNGVVARQHNYITLNASATKIPLV